MQPSAFPFGSSPNSLYLCPLLIKPEAIMAKKGKAKANVRKTTSSASSRPASKTSTQSGPSRRVSQGPEGPVRMPFTRMNYIFLAIGVGIIALGFFLMSSKDYVDATQFSVALYIAPPVVIFGFLSIIYAIMYQDKDAREEAEPVIPSEG
jgi:hypothetical protein